MRLMAKPEFLEFVRQRRRLFDEEPDSNPFASSAWLVHFVQHVASESSTFLVAECGKDDRFMILYRVDRASHATAIANYYASLYSPLIGPSVSASDVAEMVDDLRRACPAVATADFSPLDADSERTTALQKALRTSWWYPKRYFCFGNWFLTAAGLTFDDYMAARPSQIRNTWARKVKRFDGGAARLELVASGARVANAIDAFRQVYSKSWKKPEPYPEFVPDWAKICADQGWLRLGIAWLEDKPIAAQFWFTRNRRAYIYKLAYDEAHSKLSAGTVLSAFMIRHSLEVDKVTEIDYLTGDDAYKKDWMNARRERVGIRACNLRSPRGLAAAAVEGAGALRRQFAARTSAATQLARSGTDDAGVGAPPPALDDARVGASTPALQGALYGQHGT